MRRAMLAGAVAATAAAVLLVGGVVREGGGAAAALADSRSLAAAGLAHQQRWRETGDAAWLSRSEASLRAALRADGRSGEAVLGLASLALSRHRFADALALGRRAQRLLPGNAAVLGVLGDAHLELGRYREAFAAFDAFAAREPGVASYARVSYARELLGDRRGAVEAMKLAVRAAPPLGEGAAWTRVKLGDLHLDAGRLGAAERWYRAALRRRPGDASALAALGDVAVAGGDVAAAERLYRRALARGLAPDYAVSLGDMLLALGRKNEAERAFAAARARARAFARHGGRDALETALFDLDHDRNLASALARAREGLRERPSIEGEHVLAWALYKNGRCGEARIHSVRALRLGSPDLDAIYHRSLIERCLGNGAAAERFLARLRRLNPVYLRNAPSAYRLTSTAR